MEAQRNLLAMRSQEQTSRQPVTSSEAIRQFLVKAGEVYGKTLTPSLISIWVDALAGYPAGKLAIMFRRTLETFKAEYGRTFPVIADVLAHAEKVKESATGEAAEIAWKAVVEIRRVHYNPDLPQYLAQALARLPERIQRAAKAAGVFREHESAEALHVWAKKIFLESFLRWDETEDSLNLLPDGEIKNLLTQSAQAKALPAATGHDPGNGRPDYLDEPIAPQIERWTEREEATSEQLRSQINKPKMPARRGQITPEELERQKQAILSKYSTAGEEARV